MLVRVRVDLLQVPTLMTAKYKELTRRPVVAEISVFVCVSVCECVSENFKPDLSVER